MTNMPTGSLRITNAKLIDGVTIVIRNGRINETVEGISVEEMPLPTLF